MAAKFEIPFEMVVVFSTNLDPNSLADEAFLRRIQNKIFVEAVDLETFTEIFDRIVAHKHLAGRTWRLLSCWSNIAKNPVPVNCGRVTLVI